MSPSTRVLTQVNAKDSETINLSLSFQRKFFLLVFLSLALIFDVFVRQPNATLIDNKCLLEVPAER